MKSKSDSRIKLQIRDINGAVVIEKTILLKDLSRFSSFIESVKGFNKAFRTKEPEFEIDSFRKSMCFNNSTKEERFYRHFLKSLTSKEILLWLKYPLLGLAGIISLVFILTIAFIRVCFFKKSKVKIE